MAFHIENTPKNLLKMKILQKIIKMDYGIWNLNTPGITEEISSLINYLLTKLSITVKFNYVS